MVDMYHLMHIGSPHQTSGMTTAKVFMTGRSQAVRIPRQFRFDSAEVFVRRRGDSLVLTPANRKVSAYGGLRAKISAIAADFDAPVEDFKEYS